MISLTNCRSTFVIKLGNFVQSWTSGGSKIPQKIILILSSSNWSLSLICMHRETSKFKQSVLTLVSPVFSIGIRDNNIIYITPTMILYEDMKPIEHVLLHPICQVWPNVLTRGPNSRLPDRWRARCSAISVTGSSQCWCTASHNRERGAWKNCARYLVSGMELVFGRDEHGSGLDQDWSQFCPDQD